MGKDILEISQNYSNPFNIPIFKVYCKNTNSTVQQGTTKSTAGRLAADYEVLSFLRMTSLSC